MRLRDYGLEIVRVYEPSGYKLRYPDPNSEDHWTEGVIADSAGTANDPEGQLDGMEKLLNYIMDHFGVYGSDHDAERLYVVRERRDGTIVHFGKEYVPAVKDTEGNGEDTAYVLTDKGRAEIDALSEATKKA